MTEIPRYGVNITTEAQDIYDVLAEEVRLLGYTTLDSGLTGIELDDLSQLFDKAELDYNAAAAAAGYDLELLSERDTIRLLPTICPSFWKIVFNAQLHELLSRLLGNYFILNQVNGLINRGHQSKYHQALYHRDLPYQHFTSSRPLAINALFALDDFTIENGATRMIPGTHHREAFPPDEVVRRLETHAIVKRGTFIVLDCMVYHAGSTNSTVNNRRAINHVFTIPMLRQQFHMPSVLGDAQDFSDRQRKILGYGLEEFRSVEEWFKSRSPKVKSAQ